MSAHVIEAGKHYDNTLFSSKPHLFQKEFKKTVQFASDCEYELPDYNQGDANKLFGACYGLRGAHYNSVRYGWRWSRSAKKIELLAYVYNQGTRNWDEQLRFPVVAQLELGRDYTCSIRVTDEAYVFHVTQGDETIGQIVNVPHGKLACYGWTLSLYFGGEKPAVHTMHVFMDNI